MSDPVDELAPQACVSCREKKRKCSREVPVCSLCRRNRRPCHYPPKTASPFAESSESYIRQNTFPAIFFLDLYTFNKRRSVIPAPTITLPDKYYKALGSREQLHYHVDNYFSMIHPILPIVSKLRIYHQLSKSLDALDADLVLLFLAMQMHCERDGHNPPRTEIYDLAKQCCLHAEQSNMFSPRLLQASLLIAMYEVGNAIYPAAYLTVGHCARLGHVMGINNTKDGPQMFSKPESWAEAEERRRAWWAVIMLDRYVTLGGGNRPFACSDANPGDLLPMDEESWEKGEPTLIQPLVVSEYTAVRASPFARTSQASHLLSHVLRHVNDGYEDVKFHYEEAIQLHRTIDTFSLAISHELNDIKGAVRDWTHTCSHFTAMAICYSAQITLYDTYWCADADAIRGVGIPEQLEMQQISINGIKSACFAVHQLAKMISEAAQIGDMCRVNPLTTDCLYQASMLLHSYIRETGNNEYAQAVIDIVQALKVLAGIWDVAKEYLGMLDIESLGLDEQ